MAKWVNYKDGHGGIICSEAIIGAFILRVHHYMSQDKRNFIWYLSCDSLFDNTYLCFNTFAYSKRKKLSEAKCEAIAKLQIVLREALDEISKGCK